MNDFTTKIISCLAKGKKINETIQELFRLEIERAINELLKVELSELLHYQNMNEMDSVKSIQGMDLMNVSLIRVMGY